MLENATPKKLKIILLGDTQVGKSRLLARYLNQSFDDAPTIGVEFHAKNIEVKGETVQVQFWDTAGQQEYRSLISSYFKGAQGIVLVFDYNQDSSFTELDGWYSKIEKFCDVEKVPVLLIANKSDLRNDENGGDENNSTPQKYQEYAVLHQSIYKECSSMGNDTTSINEAFTSLLEETLNRDGQTNPIRNDVEVPPEAVVSVDDSSEVKPKRSVACTLL